MKIKINSIFVIALFFVISLFMAGCTAQRNLKGESKTPVQPSKTIPKPQEKIISLKPSMISQAPLTLVAPEDIPPLLDDLDKDSLLAAIGNSLLFYSRVKADTRYPIGERYCTAGELKETLLAFQEILKNCESDECRKKSITATFDFYRAAGRDQQGTVLFTGYFEPIIQGSLERNDAYPFPVYRPPEETVVVHLERFNKKYEGETVTGRLYNGEIVPHYSREDIDGKGVLKGRNLEIAWASDSIELFFLHIQGSGIMELPDGRKIRIGYARSNGRPFRGLAGVLLEQGKITEKEVSHDAVKSYLQDHPEERRDLMQKNPSYVFFRILDGENVGSHNVPLTAGRSIATDPKYFPKGALAFIKLRKPVFLEEGDGVNWTPFYRFVLNQDAGGAIKGTGRVDLFCGTGVDAERVAGSIREEGALYFLLKKKNTSGN